MLTEACEQTFNCISIDGDTSTNDTVLLLASGQSGVRLKQPTAQKEFAQALLQVCQSLAEQIVFDGEGVEHVIRLSVEQARNRDEARQSGANRGSFVIGKDRMGGRRSQLGAHSRRRRKIRNRP